jgi:hypothetical protein
MDSPATPSVAKKKNRGSTVGRPAKQRARRAARLALAAPTAGIAAEAASRVTAPLLASPNPHLLVSPMDLKREATRLRRLAEDAATQLRRLAEDAEEAYEAAVAVSNEASDPRRASRVK